MRYLALPLMSIPWILIELLGMMVLVSKNSSAIMGAQLEEVLLLPIMMSATTQPCQTDTPKDASLPTKRNFNTIS